MKKMMEQKGKGLASLSPEDKMALLESLKEAMNSIKSGDYADLKKVTVASDSKEGLQKGLEMAQDKLPEMEEPGENTEEEKTESPEVETEEEPSESSPVGIDKSVRIAELEEELRKLKA